MLGAVVKSGTKDAEGSPVLAKASDRAVMEADKGIDIGWQSPMASDRPAGADMPQQKILLGSPPPPQQN